MEQVVNMLEGKVDSNYLEMFRYIVIDDVKGSLQDESSLSLLHSNPRLWLYVLQTLRREVELQLSCQNAKLKIDISHYTNTDLLDDSNFSVEEEVERNNKVVDAKVKFYKWRMSALKFLTNIEAKTLYVKMLLSNIVIQQSDV